MGAIVTLRDNLVTRIEAERTSLTSSFPYKDFTVEAAHVPYNELKSTKLQNGVCFVIGLAQEYHNVLSRQETKKTLQRDTPIQIGFQKQCNVGSVSECDVLVNLMQALEEESIATICATGFQLITLKPMKDENETPFRYAAWRESGLFEAYFTLYYRSTVTIAS